LSESGALYVVNGLFGNEDFSSIVRIRLQGKKVKLIEGICDSIIEWRTSEKSPDVFKTAKPITSFIKNYDKTHAITLIRNLLYNGVIVLA
jgi:hypothetical protein